jgi:protein ImuB
MTDRARRAHEVDPRAPLAVVATVKAARRLVGVDARAARLGLGVGLTLADAQARQPSLVVCDAEPEAEARLLERVADACARFTPLAALDGRDGLMLDVSGVAHLFGGEEGLVAEVEARLARQGLTVAPGLADSPRAAWALARFSHRRVAPAGLAGKDFARLYHDMPAAALGLDVETCADMARAGLRRIGDLALRPRAPIAARFGADVIARLDALAGAERGAISPRFSAPELSVERRFASPIATSEAAFVALARLADDLAALLERQGKGARRLELMLFRVDGGARRIAVGAGRPLAEAKAMARLFAERLAGGAEEEIDTGFGIDLMRLSCLVAERIAPAQSEWERLEESAGARALADLVDRLSARLGTRRVTRLELIAAHLPEQAVAATPAALGEARAAGQGNRHREEQSDEAIQQQSSRPWIASPSGRNDEACDAPTRPLQAVRTAGADRDAGRSARRPAAALPLAARVARGRGDRGPRAHRRAVVAPAGRADARLFPRRRRPRPPLLALPRRPLRPRDDAGEMVRARGVRVRERRRFRFPPQAEGRE